MQHIFGLGIEQGFLSVLEITFVNTKLCSAQLKISIFYTIVTKLLMIKGI